MTCIIANIIDPTKESRLYGQLIEAFPNEDDALYFWSRLTDKDFLDNIYGVDYIEDFKKPEGNRLLQIGKHTNVDGEPLLHKNNQGEYYIFTLDGDKYWLNFNKLDLNPVSEKYLVDLALYELFGDNSTADADILEGVSFSTLYEPESSIYQLLGGNKNQIQILQGLVEKRLKDIGIKTVIDREELQDGETNDEIENSKVLDFKQSFEKDSKDNASANIKLLFNFVPKLRFVYEDGKKLYEPLTQEITFSNGVTSEQPYFASFDEVYNKFVTTLVDLSVVNNKNIIEIDKFDVMFNKMRIEYADDATVQYLLDEISKFPQFKKTEFVQAFNLATNNFITTILGEEKVNIFNSSNTNSPSNKLKKEWDNYFISQFFNYNQEESKLVYNKNKAKEVVDKINDLIGTNGKLRQKKIKYKQEYFDDLLEVLNQSGIKISEKSLYDYLKQDQKEDELDLMGSIVRLGGELSYIRTTLSKPSEAVLYQDGNPTNPLNVFAKDVGAKKIIKQLAQAELKNRIDLFENTALGADGKPNWNYSQKTYLKQKLEKLKLGDLAQTKLEDGFYKYSLWDAKVRKNIKEGNKEELDKLKIDTFLNLKKDSSGDAGIDNKKIEKADQLIDMISKTLKGRKEGENSIFYTPAMADKGRAVHIEGFDLIDVSTTGEETYTKEITDIFAGYALDEINRAIQEYEYIKDEESRIKYADRLIKDYHFKLDKKGKVNYFEYTKKDKEGNTIIVLTNDTSIKGIRPAGNAFKSALFPNLNPFVKTSMKINGDLMFDSNNQLQWTEKEFKNSPEVLDIINTTLQATYIQDYNLINNLGLLDQDNDILGIDKKIKEYHNNNTENIIRDFSINSLIANIEFSKLFMSDWAEAKGLIDLSKRYPSTITDGTYLHLRKGDPTWFKVATLPNQMVESVNLKQLRADYPQLAKAYSNINQTDAQGWITWDRWKFIMQRSNHWNPKFAEAVTRIEAGTQTAEDWQYTAQPIKGVFSGISKEGHFTYVKYSAAPLIPHVIKGTKLDELHKQMIAEGIDEAVVVDGIKLGAKLPNEIDTDDFSKSKFYTTELRNDEYKIQQDLTPKGNKQTLLGSQLTKNIIEGITKDQQLGDLLGEQVVNDLVDVVSDLSNKGKLQLNKELGLDVDGNIVNKEAFYDKLVKTVIDKNSPDNLITALKRETPLDLIANKRTEIQYILQSVIKKATVDIKTNGGAYIQQSSWLIDEFIDDYNIDQLGIKMLVDRNRLQAPEVITANGKKKVKPGQVFISSQYISKLVPNWKKLTNEELRALFQDEKTKRIIGYRIPNQTLSSTDSLEIVGILPESSGDTIIPYADITTKTGSDFDIDKMYIIMPNLKVKYTKGTYKNAKEFIKNNIGDDLESLQDILDKYDIELDEEDLKLMFDISSSEVQKKVDVKEGVSELFESNPELANIGTPEQYSQYLDTIFPDSKVKDIVYHGTDNKEKILKEGFKNNAELFEPDDDRTYESGELGYGYYFTTTQQAAKNYGEPLAVILNNPDITNETTFNLITNEKGIQHFVKLKEQIHILGSKQDIEEFKKFVNSNKKSVVEIKRQKQQDKRLQEKQIFNKAKDDVITKILFSDNNELADKYRKEYGVGKVEKLEYIEYDNTKSANKQPKEAVENKLIETMRAVLEAPEMFEKMMSPLDNKALEKDVRETFKEYFQDEIDPGLNFFSASYQINKKFDNSVGKKGVGLKSNQLVDMPLAQLADLKMNRDLGINPIEQIKKQKDTKKFKKVKESRLVFGEFQKIGKKTTFKDFEGYDIIATEAPNFKGFLTKTNDGNYNILEKTTGNFLPLRGFVGNTQKEVLDAANKQLAEINITSNEKLAEEIGLSYKQIEVEKEIYTSSKFDPLQQLEEDLKYKGNQTSFNHIKDATGEFNISEVLSMGLNGYLEIAKEDFTSKGNRIPETENVVSMLERAGIPFRIVNRIIGQESVREYINEKKSREARIVEPKYNSVRDETINKLINKYEIPENRLNDIKSKTLSAEATIEELTSFRDKKQYDKIQKYFEKGLNKPKVNYTLGDNLTDEESTNNKKIEDYITNQISMLDYYTYLETLGNDFAQTVLSTKQDVNGAGKDFISALVDKNKVSKLKQNNLFENYQAKFDNTFLGTYYDNSTELSLKIFEQALVTATPYAQEIYNTISNIINPEEELLTNSNLGFLLEKSLFSTILGSTDLRASTQSLESLFVGDNTLYDQLFKLKDKYQDSPFLNLLEGDIKQKYKFVNFDNTKKKSVEILNNFTRHWEQAIDQEEDQELKSFAEDLIIYTFNTSGFQTNMNSFYEHIPVNRLEPLVENGIYHFKEFLADSGTDSTSLINEIFRNNWHKPELVPVLKRNQLNGVKIINKNVLKLPEIKSGSFKGIHNKPYILLSNGNDGVLYQKVATEKTPKEAYFIYKPVPKLGIRLGNQYIYEYGNTSNISAFSENNKEYYKEVFKFVEENIKQGVFQRNISKITPIDYNEFSVEVELNNINCK